MSRIHISHRGVTSVGAYNVLMPREAGKPKYTTSLDGQAVEGFVLLGNRDHLDALQTWLKRGRQFSSEEFAHFMRGQLDGRVSLVVLTEPKNAANGDFDFKVFTTTSNGRVVPWVQTIASFMVKGPFDQYVRLPSPGSQPRLSMTAYPITARHMLTFYNEELARPYVFWSHISYTRRGPQLRHHFVRDVPRADRARLRLKPKARTTRNVPRFGLMAVVHLS